MHVPVSTISFGVGASPVRLGALRRATMRDERLWSGGLVRGRSACETPKSAINVSNFSPRGSFSTTDERGHERLTLRRIEGY